MGPLLALGHDWQRQRAVLRDGRSKPPPLVAAGLDVGFDPSAGRTLGMGGLAVIFGHFPPGLRELLSLARARLHLGPDQARELDPVLNARLLAMWAWLPTRHQDVYLEFDRATGVCQVWLIGPGEATEQIVAEPDDEEAAHELLAEDFLDGLVLNGSGGWGGEAGLERLIGQYGLRPLLVAAQIADFLERHGKEPHLALAAAQMRWRELSTSDERPWANLVGNEHPWTLLQLGRLALRLGLMRAARAMLSANPAAEWSPVAWFDLGQVDEALDDLPAAETAFARYAAARPGDPDAWRRLLFCRLRLNRAAIADETLRRYRAAGGTDNELAERWLGTVCRGRLRLHERTVIAAWCEARLGHALAATAAANRLVEEFGVRHGAGRIAALADALRLLVRHQGLADADADAVARVVLLALPLGADPHRGEAPPTVANCMAAATTAVADWWDWCERGGPPPRLDEPALASLARLAAG